MAIRFLFLPFKGKFDFALVPTAGAPPTGGTFLFVDSSNFAFIDGTDVDFVT